LKGRSIGIVLGLVFAMLLALSQLAVAAPSSSIDLTFDGYCDGMHLNIPSLGVGSAGTVDGDHTGCVTGGFEGTTSSKPSGAHITTTYGGLVPPLLHYQVRSNHTWTVYGINGDLITLVNSGTWSPGAPKGNAGLPSGLARAARPITAPSTALDITFDGYCDGLHLNIPSVGLGATGTVDGDHTGCISGGFVGTTSTKPVPSAARLSTDYGGGAPQLLHIVVYANHTWVIYSISGDLQSFINSGTWSPGVPRGSGSPAAAG
jgi:hypothetical protein